MKRAQVISLQGNSLLVGGNWSAGDRYAKKPSWTKEARAEGFNPKSISAVWMPEEKQVGWFEFGERKPVRAAVLAWVAQQRMVQDSLPWRGVFNLGEAGWWFIGFDERGAVHPALDELIEDGGQDQFEAQHLEVLSSLTYSHYCATLEESLEWLFTDDLNVKSAAVAVPLDAQQQAAKKAVIGVAVAACLVGGGLYGLRVWKRHQMLVMQQKQALQQAQQARLDRERAAQSMTQAQLLRAKVEAAWAATPRPWMAAPSAQSVWSACMSNMGPASESGWRLSQLTCTVQGANLDVKRTYVRSQFATVASAPSGAVNADGNTVEQTQTVALASGAATAAAQATLPPSASVQTDWMAASQSLSSVYLIRLGKPVEFFPTVPDFVPKDQVQAFHPPKLWNVMSVNVDAAMSVEPDLRLPIFSTPGFVLESIQASLQTRSISWKLEGKQYANP